MKRYVTGLIAALVVVGFWTVVGPDGLAKAQSGCAGQGAVDPSETVLAFRSVGGDAGTTLSDGAFYLVSELHVK